MKRLTLLAAFAASAFTLHAQQPVVVGYILSEHHAISASQIDATRLTRIDYAFLHPEDGVVSAPTPIDDANLQTLASLRKQHPQLQLVLSIGGGANSMGFSAATENDKARQRFIASCIELVRRYQLDGLDIDWEYPGAQHPDKTVYPEDKQNYTNLLRELRAALDVESPQRHLVLTTATNGKPFFIHATNLGEVAKYVDAIALMGYDVYNRSSATTGHQSPLFTSPDDPTPYSDDEFVHAYEQAGVPPEKILLGVPFYGFVWQNVSKLHHGLFQDVTPGHAKDVPYGEIESSYLAAGSGFTRTWDEAAHVPTLYNDTTHTFVSYEDPASLTDKVHYITEHHLAGIMFWEYNLDDANNTLLKTMWSAYSSVLTPAKTK